MKLEYLPFDRTNQDFIHKAGDKLDKPKSLLFRVFLMILHKSYYLIYSFSHRSAKMFISLLSGA